MPPFVGDWTGFIVGPGVGLLDTGDDEGLLVGGLVTGESLGTRVGLLDTGEKDGVFVGGVVVGAVVIGLRVAVAEGLETGAPVSAVLASTPVSVGDSDNCAVGA